MKATELVPLQDYMATVPAFVKAIQNEAMQLGLNLGPFEMDHFCLRVENTEQYVFYKSEAEYVGVLLSEAIIGGRPIASYKLNDEIVIGAKRISCMEIPSPKEGAPYALGLEHVECVIAEALTIFIQRYPHLKFDTRALKKPINPEITLKLASGKTVKFHNQSLEQVIEIEKKLGL